MEGQKKNKQISLFKCVLIHGPNRTKKSSKKNAKKISPFEFREIEIPYPSVQTGNGFLNAGYLIAGCLDKITFSSGTLLEVWDTEEGFYESKFLFTFFCEIMQGRPVLPEKFSNPKLSP